LLLPNQAITVRAAPQITTKRCHSHASKTRKKQAGTDPQSGTTPVRSLQGYRFTVHCSQNRRWPQLKSPKPKNETKFRSYSLTLHGIHVKLPGQLHILPLCPGGGDKNKYKTISIYVQIKVIIIAKTNSNSSAICKSRDTGRQTERTFLRPVHRGGAKKCAQAPLKRDKYCCEIESIWYTLTKNSEAHQNKKARAENTYCCQLIIYSRENCNINCCRNDISLCRLKGEKQRATFCIGRQTERTFLRPVRRGGGKKCAQAPLKRDKYCCEIESIWYTLTKNSEAHQNKKARAENTYYCQLIIYSRENCDINCCRNDISLCRLKGEREIFCIGRQTQRTFLRPVRRGGGGKVRTDHFET
jgi:hypothetical protein